MNTTSHSLNTVRRRDGFLSGIGQRFARYKTYRTTLNELERLSDHELADLGLSRAQLRSIAYKSAYEG